MTKENITEKVRQAFLGHNVVMVKCIAREDKELYRLVIGGQSFEIGDFNRLGTLFESEYKVLFNIESNVLTITLMKE